MAIERILVTARQPAVLVIVGALGSIALRWLYARTVVLTLDDYRSWWIADGLVTGRSTLMLLASALLALLLARCEWVDIEAGRAVRVVVAVAVATLAIGFSLYARNEYLDRSHLLDRALVLALAVGAAWRLALLPVFTFVCYAVIGQFSLPLGSYSWTDKLVIFEVLWAIQIVLAWQVMVRSRRLIANAYGSLERSIDADSLDELTRENLSRRRKRSAWSDTPKAGRGCSTTSSVPSAAPGRADGGSTGGH